MASLKSSDETSRLPVGLALDLHRIASLCRDTVSQRSSARVMSRGRWALETNAGMGIELADTIVTKLYV